MQNTNHGYILSITPEEKTYSNDTVTAVIKHDTGYRLKECWYTPTAGGEKTPITTAAVTEETDADARSFTMPAYPVTVYASFVKVKIDVTLTASWDFIMAGDPVEITVKADGEQNCADIELTYNSEIFDYTAPTPPDSEVIVPETPNGTLRILSYNTAETVKTLTFTAKNTLPHDEMAQFGFNSAKFAATESAMTADAVDAKTTTGTTVFVQSIMRTVTFRDGTETVGTKEYFGNGQKIAAEDIPADPEKPGYKFNGWKNGSTVYTATDLVDIFVPREGITYWADYSPDVTVTVQANYVHGTETEATSYTKIIVEGILDGYTYNGKAMYKVADETFAYIVLTNDYLAAEEGAVEYATGLVGVAATAADDISVTDPNDVNGTGVVDIADARAVFNCANKLVDLDTYMKVFIRADLDGDGTVNADDAARVINAIKTAGTVDANA